MSATRGRQRKLDSAAQTKLCQLIAAGATVAAAANRVGVTLRTVQREVSDNEDFEHDLRLAEEAAPVDPLRLMQAAAKAHWRAAAWLLERTDPETYGKRPPAACTAAQFQRALDSILKATLEQAPPLVRRDISQSFQAAAQQAQAALFTRRDQAGRAQPFTLSIGSQPLVDQQPPHAPLDAGVPCPRPRGHATAHRTSGILSPEMQQPSDPTATPPNLSPTEDAPRQNTSAQLGAAKELTPRPMSFVAKNELRDKTPADGAPGPRPRGHVEVNNPAGILSPEIAVTKNAASVTPTSKSKKTKSSSKSRHNSQPATRASRLASNSVAKNALDAQLDALEARALHLPWRRA